MENNELIKSIINNSTITKPKSKLEILLNNSSRTFLVYEDISVVAEKIAMAKSNNTSTSFMYYDRLLNKGGNIVVSPNKTPLINISELSDNDPVLNNYRSVCDLEDYKFNNLMTLDEVFSNRDTLNGYGIIVYIKKSDHTHTVYDTGITILDSDIKKSLTEFINMWYVNIRDEYFAPNEMHIDWIDTHDKNC